VADHDHVAEAEEQELRAETEARRRLALAQIRQYPDSALRLVAKPLDRFDEDLSRLAERMIKLMRDAQGVGLAATQVGILRRLFVFEVDGEEPRAVVNPEVVPRDRDRESDEEGCLSLQGVRVPVERSVRVTLRGVDPDGEPVEWSLEGLGARVVQHELDHLDGTLIIDRTDDESRKQALATLRPQPILR
jgi:peptide deformylase